MSIQDEMPLDSVSRALLGFGDVENPLLRHFHGLAEDLKARQEPGAYPVNPPMDSPMDGPKTPFNQSWWTKLQRVLLQGGHHIGRR